MNRLSNERRAQVLTCLVEGVGINSTVRMTGVAKTTILRLLAEAGEFCDLYQAYRFRNLSCKRIEADEIWSFWGAKNKNAKQAGHGDIWTFTALDPDTKLMVAWAVGSRGPQTATHVIEDLAARVGGRIQLTTDGYEGYLNPIRAAFGHHIDYAQLVKSFEHENEPPSIRKTRMIGNPDPALISTSLVERANLTMRGRMRRFVRKTTGFSRKALNHAYNVDLCFMASNFIFPHHTLTARHNGRKTTPAMEEGLEQRPWTMLDVVERMDPAVLIAA